MAISSVRIDQIANHKRWDPLTDWWLNRGGRGLSCCWTSWPHPAPHKYDFILCWFQKGLQAVGGALESAALSFEIAAGACWRSRMLRHRSKLLLGPARSRMCARNRSSDLFRSPHASNAVPRDRSRSRSLRGEGNDIVIDRATVPQLFYNFL